MKSQKRKRIHIILIAIGILLLSSALLVTSVYAAQGAEESKVISVEEDESAPAAKKTGAVTKETSDDPNMETASQPLPTEPPAVETQQPSSESVSEASLECITEEEAVAIFIKTASDLFGLEIDQKDLTVNFNDERHKGWAISLGSDLSCGIDAISGDVLSFMINSNYEYQGEKITLSEFDAGYMAPESDISDIYSDDNVYITTAKQLVIDHLADGRTIENIEVDGVQFVWDNSSDGFDPGATGTILVDCHVYMNTGNCYTLSILGTNQLELHWFNTHPTQDACRWGYYYEEEADIPGKEGVEEEWQTADGIEAEPTPPPSLAPTQAPIQTPIQTPTPTQAPQ